MKRALGLKRRSEGLDVDSAIVLELASKCYFLQGVSDTNLTPAMAAAPEHSENEADGRCFSLLPHCPPGSRLAPSTQRASNPGCRQGAACRAELFGEQIPEQVPSMLFLFAGRALYRLGVCP